jgi:hypothetical protein
VTHLPTTCGSAGGFDTQGVTITKLTDSFANGHIDITGTATKSGFCYDASASFHGTLTLTLSGGTLVPDVALDQPNVSIDIPWYCFLAAAVVLGPLGLAIGAAVEIVGPTIAEALASNSIKQALGSGLPTVGTGGLGAGQLKSVSITTEGLTLQGVVPIFVSTPFVSKMLDLNGSVTTTNKSTISTGVFHAKVWCMATAKDYPYTEYSQHQEGTFQLTGQLVQLPLTPAFTVSANGPEIALTGTVGTVAIPNVDAHFPMPLATGGAKVTQTVHIDYEVVGTTVKLRNRPEEGDYSFWLNATATGCKGQPINDDNNKAPSTFTFVEFEGDHVEIGGGFAADVQYCAQLLASFAQKYSQEYSIWQKVPIWVEVNYPAPEELAAYVRDLVSLGLRETDDVLRAIKTAHGNSFVRAMLSPAATHPALLTGAKAIIEVRNVNAKTIG